AARGGTAVDRFARVRDRLRERFRLRVVETDPTGEWRSAVWDAIRADGLRVVVAAGGDGTVHAVVNTLFDLGAPRGLVLGAIGLGSSNDYHKPVRAEIAGIPVRLDVANARPRDLLLARWDRDGIAQREVVVVSASLGVTAAANAFFNRGDAILRVLKGRWTAGAIAYAALRTLVTHPGSRGSVILEGERWSGSLANLSFLEAPYLSGSLRYDLPAAEDDG
ncbi:MAG: hypothetical protein GWN71_40685, partial [Gammaproteobacteria bacterium]|nr:hypothetical protein [Gemmatimonadota bacterium]NIR36814.1 hypothetical protein [Actinomycetota bacterium]NIU79633.1 hypothetical protein [Gammaproteobacteria bacterium]NIY12645.1 hypothetical protein [Gemmatimonadota bacterium]